MAVSSGPEISRGPEVSVRLMGKVAEFAREREPLGGAVVKTRLPDETTSTTPRQLIAQIADENPLLRDQMVRRDGSPRSSTRILLNGQAPDDLDAKIEIRDDPETAQRVVVVVIFGDGTVVIITDIVIIVVVPCDG